MWCLQAFKACKTPHSLQHLSCAVQHTDTPRRCAHKAPRQLSNGDDNYETFDDLEALSSAWNQYSTAHGHSPASGHDGLYSGSAGVRWPAPSLQCTVVQAVHQKCPTARRPIISTNHFDASMSAWEWADAVRQDLHQCGPHLKTSHTSSLCIPAVNMEQKCSMQWQSKERTAR